jgi:hypothetical protein
VQQFLRQCADGPQNQTRGDSNRKACCSQNSHARLHPHADLTRVFWFQATRATQKGYAVELRKAGDCDTADQAQYARHEGHNSSSERSRQFRSGKKAAEHQPFPDEAVKQRQAHNRATGNQDDGSRCPHPVE